MMMSQQLQKVPVPGRGKGGHFGLPFAAATLGDAA